MHDHSLESRLTGALARLDDEETLAAARALMEEGTDFSVINRCLDAGLEQVKKQFEEGSYFIADLMYSGMLYRSVLELLPSSQAGGSLSKKGRVLIGVVEKDIHDIGKDIVASLLASDGYEVINLGTNVTPQAFVDAIEAHRPQIVLMSGMMSFALDSMKRTVEAITEAGLRDHVHILVGGGCVDAALAEEIGADGLAAAPLDTLNRCNQFLAREGGSHE